jgi:hypothetical protein
METIWTFRTNRFRIALEVAPEYDLDLSFDDDGRVRDKLDRGLLVAFQARVVVYLDGREVGADYLGACIYESAEQFREESGYFADMVRAAIREARQTLNHAPRLRAA